MSLRHALRDGVWGMIEFPTEVWCVHLSTILIEIALICAVIRLIIMWCGTSSDGAMMIRQGDRTQEGSSGRSLLCLKSRH